MTDNTSKQKYWSGRFQEPVAELVKKYTASIEFDYRLAMHDIIGSLAHAEMLNQTGTLSDADYASIKNGLEKIKNEILDDSFSWSIEHEDIHLNIENRLIDLIGEPGKKLHTGRSRNDQVATDIRMYLRDTTDQILDGIREFQIALLNLAERHINTPAPGFTHLQIAQPISFAHHIMAYFEMMDRNQQRFMETRSRINCLPLGSAALAGTTFPIDRNIVAKKLGFDQITKNSMDAVSDRDFAIEFCANASILMMHFSRLSEELIIWSSTPFSFVKIADRFCTGSSIMPQKKNPDVPELVRGKTGRVYGHLMSILTIMKSQPLTYNKDNQEDKEPLFDTAENVLLTLKIYSDLVSGVEVNIENMEKFSRAGFSTATDLADYLVRKNIPFKESHEIVANIVHEAEIKGLELHELSLKELRKFSNLIENDVMQELTIEGSINARNHFGGTAKKQVMAAIDAARKTIEGK